MQPKSWIYVHIWLNNDLIKLYFKEAKKTTGLVSLAFSELEEKNHSKQRSLGHDTLEGFEEDSGGMYKMPVFC